MANIIICCDGTGNKTEIDQTNVLRLSRLAKRADTDQKVFYDQGIGTVEIPSPTTSWFADLIDEKRKQAIGHGLEQKVINAYRALVERYEKDDKIFLFGFSRGAYTVRVLAAMIHKIGLLRRDDLEAVGAGLIEFMKFSAKQKTNDGTTIKTKEWDESDEAYVFGRFRETRWVTIDFVGVWDTVASRIVPEKEKLLSVPAPSILAYTRRNPSVKRFRHAMAIDECRAFFQIEPWQEPQDFHARAPTNPTDFSVERQDVRQVWFAGSHADVGGGYKEEESGLSKYPLIWIVEDAVQAGMNIDPKLYDRTAWGKNLDGILFHAEPSFAEPHDSMSIWWSALGGGPRPIPEGSSIHESVLRCSEHVPAYRPQNLPRTRDVVPMMTYDKRVGTARR